MPKGQEIMTSSGRNYSYDFLPLETLLLLQPVCSTLWMRARNAFLLNYRELWHFLCWGAVAAVVGDGGLNVGMIAYPRDTCAPVYVCVCVCFPFDWQTEDISAKWVHFGWAP